MANLSKTKTLFCFTSPRDIIKIIPEIELLIENFSGEKWSGNADLQGAFFDILFNSGYYEGSRYPEDPAFAARDRITRAPKALGFINLKPEIQLTEVGGVLLSGKRIQETFTRQLLKFQLPSPYHAGFPIEFKVKPFLELLRLISEAGSLSKIESALFFLQLSSYKKFDEILEKILLFRKEKKRYKGSWKSYVHESFNEEITKIYDEEIGEKEFKTRESKELTLRKFISTKKSNMLDYADAFERHIRASELVTYEKNSYRLIISPYKVDEVKFLLSTINREPTNFANEDEFKQYLFSSQNVKLLVDDKAKILKKLNNYDIEIGKGVYDIEELKDILEETERRILDETVEETKNSLKSYSEFGNIVEVFEQIVNREVPDPPLFLEWNVWRAMAMINYALEVNGNFRMDLDGMPINTALGNIPDIEVIYPNFRLILEVTMSSGSRQFEQENESVPRHLGKIKAESDEEVYCLFIAKVISPATLAYFFNLNKMNTKLYGGKTKIIPISIRQFINFLHLAKDKNFSDPQILNQFMDKVLEYNQTCKDEDDWALFVNERINNWL